jgi:voltage-gated potassium channel
MSKDKQPIVKRTTPDPPPPQTPNKPEISNQDFWDSALWIVDLLARPLVVISITLFLIEKELSMRNGWESSLEAPWYYLWSERFIAVLFTLEIGIRWWRSNPWYYGAPSTRYPFTIWGLIDVIAIFPFWVGFFLPVQYLGLVRTLRILRALKFFRYSRGLQLTALKFYRAYHNLKGLVFSVGIMWLFFAIVCLELERNVQPEAFNSLLDVAWFTIVTGTTVGYGDMSPITLWGKVFVGLMLVPIIGSIGMAISAFGKACDDVQALEDDPSIDPLEEWTRERVRMTERRKSEKAYHMKE